MMSRKNNATPCFFLVNLFSATSPNASFLLAVVAAVLPSSLRVVIDCTRLTHMNG